MGIIDALKSGIGRAKDLLTSDRQTRRAMPQRRELRGVHRLTWEQVKAIKPSPGRMVHVSKPIPEGLAEAMRLTLASGISRDAVMRAANTWMSNVPGVTYIKAKP